MIERNKKKNIQLLNQNKINNLWAKEIFELKKHFPDIVVPEQGIDLEDLLVGIEISEKKLVKTHLGGFLLIFDECISWLSTFHIWLMEKNELRDIGCLIGMTCTQAVAIRKLILSGLDSPARAVLRTLFETLCISILILDDTELMGRFKKTNDSFNFWHENFARGRIFNKLNDLCIRKNIYDPATKVFRDWIKSEYSILSQTIHPTFDAAALSTYQKSLEDIDIFKIGTWGRASAFSEYTLKSGCLIIFYFARIGFFALIPNIKENEKTRFMLDKNDPTYLGVIMGRNVISSLVIKYI
jgi:hypothetical protein